MKNVYHGNWTCKKDITDSFAIDESALEDAVVLMASYFYEDYSGSAFVLFERFGKMYEVHGSHCSCNGLEENEWEPEEVTAEELLFRMKEGNLWYFHYEHKEEMEAILERKLKRKIKKQ